MPGSRGTVIGGPLFNHGHLCGARQLGLHFWPFVPGAFTVDLASPHVAVSAFREGPAMAGSTEIPWQCGNAESRMAMETNQSVGPGRYGGWRWRKRANTPEKEKSASDADVNEVQIANGRLMRYDIRTYVGNTTFYSIILGLFRPSMGQNVLGPVRYGHHFVKIERESQLSQDILVGLDGIVGPLIPRQNLSDDPLLDVDRKTLKESQLLGMHGHVTENEIERMTRVDLFFTFPYRALRDRILLANNKMKAFQKMVRRLRLLGQACISPNNHVVDLVVGADVGFCEMPCDILSPFLQ